MAKAAPQPSRKAKKSQVEAFREKAHEIGADRPGDDDEVMKRLAGQKRHPEHKKPSR